MTGNLPQKMVKFFDIGFSPKKAEFLFLRVQIHYGMLDQHVGTTLHSELAPLKHFCMNSLFMMHHFAGLFT